MEQASSSFNAVEVLPLGVLMGLGVVPMAFVHSVQPAVLLMTVLGTSAGFFVIPMNAVLQHRGHAPMGPGESIAVQNFNENIGAVCSVILCTVVVPRVVNQRRDRAVRLIRSGRHGAGDVAPSAQSCQWWPFGD